VLINIIENQKQQTTYVKATVKKIKKTQKAGKQKMKLFTLCSQKYGPMPIFPCANFKFDNQNQTEICGHQVILQQITK